jgi:oxygen-dependent protoporphyrinogen oxidase
MTPRIAVIGGGIAGLAAAHRLVELARPPRGEIDVRLFEAGPRLGGTIATERGDDFIIEAGPDAFLTEKPHALKLCERLGLIDRIVGTREEFRRTYIVRGAKLHPLPEGFLLLAPTRFWPLLFSSLFSWHGKCRMALDLILPRGPSQTDESLTSFVTRRLGREALERVAQPLVGGIYTSDPDRLSVAATMPRFLEMERKHRSIILAMWKQQRLGSSRAGSGARWSLFASFRDGMQELVDALAKRLPEGVVHLQTPVRTLRRSADGWLLNGDLRCDAVILAAPALASARMLSEQDSVLSAELRDIPYASSATVTLAYRREDIPHPLDCFGFVVPAIEGRDILACTFSSLKFPSRAPAEFILLRCFVGGQLQPHLLDRDDPALEETVRRELGQLLGIVADPVLRRAHRHPEAMPQYHVGHLDRVERIERRTSENHPGLQLVGAAYRGVGIPDCIRSGEEAAERVLERLKARGCRL